MDGTGGIHVQKKGGNQQCRAENTVDYVTMSFWEGNKEKNEDTWIADYEVDGGCA